jgi:pSer/pThr/pTyr-binding forkhead associated (FHA) protein
MVGRAHELTVDRTTIGRVEDNTFHIADGSVSSHHCEVHLRGEEVLIRDLNSTNGTFINNDKITEAVLKPGQTLRLGQVELKLETGAQASADPTPIPGQTPAPGGEPAAGAGKRKQMNATIVIPRGVSLDQLEQGSQGKGLASATAFSKKRDKTNTIFLIAGIVVAIVIVGLLVMVWIQVSSHH